MAGNTYKCWLKSKNQTYKEQLEDSYFACILGAVPTETYTIVLFKPTVDNVEVQSDSLVIKITYENILMISYKMENNEMKDPKIETIPLNRYVIKNPLTCQQSNQEPGLLESFNPSVLQRLNIEKMHG
jgi:hypothetical protein